MALFKISSGKTANALAAKAKEEGHCWFTTEDQRFYIDYKDSAGTLQRKYINQTDLADKASISTSNVYNGEQKFQHSQYCATAQDNANGVGCAYKASRGAVNQEVIGEIIMPSTAISDSTFNMNNEVNKIKFEKITGTSDGQPTLELVATMTPNAFTMKGNIVASGELISEGKTAAESSTSFAVWNSNTLCSQSVTAYTATEIQTFWDSVTV